MFSLSAVWSHSVTHICLYHISLNLHVRFLLIFPFLSLHTCLGICLSIFIYRSLNDCYLDLFVYFADRFSRFPFFSFLFAICLIAIISCSFTGTAFLLLLYLVSWEIAHIGAERNICLYLSWASLQHGREWYRFESDF